MVTKIGKPAITKDSKDGKTAFIKSPIPITKAPDAQYPVPSLYENRFRNSIINPIIKLIPEFTIFIMSKLFSSMFAIYFNLFKTFTLFNYT